MPQPAKALAFVGIPDGAFRTIAFIWQARNLRAMRNWLREVLHTTNPAYPVTEEARLLVQVVNHVDGKAPSWTTDVPRCFHRSLIDTGLAPADMPVREQAADGSAAWTVRRPADAVFINVPRGWSTFLRPCRRATDRHVQSKPKRFGRSSGR